MTRSSDFGPFQCSPEYRDRDHAAGGRRGVLVNRISFLAVALLPLIIATPRATADDVPVTAASPKPALNYEVDLVALNKLFALHEAVPAGLSNQFPYRVNSVEEAFTLQMQLGAGRTYNVGSHLFGPKFIPIPYADEEPALDAAGNQHRGDEAVARYFPPGEIGFALKHHRPFHRVLRMETELNTNLPGSELAGKPLPAALTLDREPDLGMAKEEIKLQDTHIEIVMGVVRDGQPGIITVNNPQDYQEGGFGDETVSGDYPMVFTKPVLPAYVPEKIRPLFIENIRTMAVGFNTVSRFPPNYDGGDPLAANTPGKIREHVKMMIKAVAGDADAQDFFHRPENFMYCAELAFVSTTAGLLVPLNQKSMQLLGVTPEEWEKFKAQIALHNQHDTDHPSFFVRNNRNFRIHLVQLADLDQLASLKPLPEYSDTPGKESAKLAFQPMTMADIVESFMRLDFPRKEMGEDLAPYQAHTLVLMKPGLLQMMGLDPASPQAFAVSRLYDEIVAVVGKKYDNYDSFRVAVNPLLQKARAMSGPLDSGQGLFTPPCLFHLALKGMHPEGGLITLKYVGHGLHYSLIKPK
jgi:hypothetical protein